MSTKRKKQLFEDILDEALLKKDTSVNTSVNTPVKVSENTPTNVSASVSVLETENVSGDIPMHVDVDGPTVEHVEVSGLNSIYEDGDISEYENTFESTNDYEDKSEFGMGDIHKFINEAVNVRELQKQIKSKKKKVKFEESHSKRTLWIRKDIQEILDMEVKNGGNITKEVNAALQLWFNLKSKGLI